MSHPPSAEAPTLQVWRFHPQGSRLTRADATLGGGAPLPARQYCGPFMAANGAGYYLHSPVDMDVSYDPRQEPRWTYQVLGEGYTDDDLKVMQAMPMEHHAYDRERLTPRTKMFFAPENYEPQHTVQIWTGMAFRTPPGWFLWIRSPINRELTRPFRVMEAILETDWMWHDIWLNLRFSHMGVTTSLRRDGPPLAQIVPVPRSSAEQWRLDERQLTPDDPEAQEIFNWWLRYDWEKRYSRSDGEIDRACYHKMRQEHYGRSSVERGEGA